MHDYNFTWRRGIGTVDWMEEKIDRAVITRSWLDLFPTAQLHNLGFFTFDHAILEVKLHITQQSSYYSIISK